MRGVGDQYAADTAVRQEGASTVHVSGVPSADGKDKTQEFKFDAVLGADATQEEVFDSALQHLCPASVLTASWSH